MTGQIMQTEGKGKFHSILEVFKVVCDMVIVISIQHYYELLFTKCKSHIWHTLIFSNIKVRHAIFLELPLISK